MSLCCQFGGAIVCTHIDWPGPTGGEKMAGKKPKKAERALVFPPTFGTITVSEVEGGDRRMATARKVSKAAPKKPNKPVGKKVKG